MSYIKIRFGSGFEKDHFKTADAATDLFQSMNPMFSMAKAAWKPQMDLFETLTEIVVHVAMAGVSIDNIEIEISNNAIKILGKRSKPVRNEATYRLAEIQYGQFERILYLPCEIETENVNAAYDNGFLTITLTKKT